VNTLGGFVCECPSGFVSVANKSLCLPDVNFRLNSTINLVTDSGPITQPEVKKATNISKVDENLGFVTEVDEDHGELLLKFDNRLSFFVCFQGIKSTVDASKHIDTETKFLEKDTNSFMVIELAHSMMMFGHKTDKITVDN